MLDHTRNALGRLQQAVPRAGLVHVHLERPKDGRLASRAGRIRADQGAQEVAGAPQAHAARPRPRRPPVGGPQKAAKVAVPVAGATWTMTWFPHIKPDLQSVANLLDISAA